MFFFFFFAYQGATADAMQMGSDLVRYKEVGQAFYLIAEAVVVNVEHSSHTRTHTCTHTHTHSLSLAWQAAEAAARELEQNSVSKKVCTPYTRVLLFQCAQHVFLGALGWQPHVRCCCRVALCLHLLLQVQAAEERAELAEEEMERTREQFEAFRTYNQQLLQKVCCWYKEGREKTVERRSPTTPHTPSLTPAPTPPRARRRKS